MSPIRIGIIGSGYMGVTHAKAAVDCPATRLMAVAGGTRAPKLASDFACALEPTPAALIARDDIDAVILATPHYVHTEHALLALDQGKHVLVEKPLATSVEDCNAMIEAAGRVGRVLNVGFHQRFRTNNKAAWSAVRSGVLGKVFAVQVTAVSSLAPLLSDAGFGGNWAWWMDPRSLGYILNLGPHVIDLLRWLLATDVRSVSALCRTTLAGAPVEDTTLALIDLQQGAVVSLTSSCMAAAPGLPGEEFRFRFLGTDATLDLDPYTELRLSEAGAWKTISAQPAIDFKSSAGLLNATRMQAYGDQMAAFAASIQGEPSGIGSGADGRAAVQVCLAMLEASATGRICILS